MKIQVNEELRYSSDTFLKRKKKKKIIDRGTLEVINQSVLILHFQDRLNETLKFVSS